MFQVREWILLLGISSAAGPLIQLHAKVNTNVYQKLLHQRTFHSPSSASNQPAISMQDNARGHPAKQVKPLP